jgi:hypothetical protein
MWQTIKELLADDAFFYTLLIVLVGAVSFGLGQRSALVYGEGEQVQQAAAVVTPARDAAGRAATPPAPTNTASPSPVATVVVSKNGTRYHLPDYPGAKQISEQNLISFESITAAQAAGYTAAANCPGLE